MKNKTKTFGIVASTSLLLGILCVVAAILLTNRFLLLLGGILLFFSLMVAIAGLIKPERGALGKTLCALPLPKKARHFIYDTDEDDDMSVEFFAKHKEIIPDVTNGYYFLVDKNDTCLTSEIEDRFGEHADYRNFYLGIYDVENYVLYYYEFDS